MPWCPKCSHEYIEGTEKCPDCGSTLKKAPGLSEAIQIDGLEWIIVRSVNDPHQAELIRGFLESNGIAVSIRDKVGSLRSLLGEFPFAKGAMDIYVPEHKAREAAILVREGSEWNEEELTAYMEAHGKLDDEEEDDYTER